MTDLARKTATRDERNPRRAATQSVGLDGGPVVASPSDGPLPDRIGNYRIIRVIGRGGMGVVYEAEHSLLGRRVALKTLAPGKVNKRRTARFLGEARTASTLRHPAIVPVLDAGHDAGQAWLVMELIDGPTLDERLQAGPLSPAEAVRTLLPIARALAHAHGRQIVHRDVKPGNVLLDGAGNAYLADFGLACDLMSADEPSPSHRPMGTLGYTAPEQTRGEAVGPSADVFAFGATLYQCLTGKTPHAAATTFDAHLKLVSSRAAPRPSARNRAVDRQLDALVRRCLARRPQDRPQDGAALVAALEGWVAARDARPTSPAAPATSPPATGRRAPVSARFAAAAVGLATALGLAGEVARRGLELRGSMAQAARADAQQAAAGARSTSGRIAAWDLHLEAHPDDVEARLTRATLLRALSRERRVAGDRAAASAAARAALADLRAVRGALGVQGPPDENGRAEAALAARLLLAEAELARVDLDDVSTAEAAYEALAAGAGPLADYARARRLHARGDDGGALELLRRVLAVRPDLEAARSLHDLLAPGLAPRVPSAVLTPSQG